MNHLLCAQAAPCRACLSWFHVSGVLLLLAVVAGGLAPLAGADEPAAKPEYFPQPNEVQQRIDAVLNRNVSFELAEMPIEKAVADIERMIEGEVSFHFDRRALEDAGVGLDTPVSGKFRNIPLRTALRLLLEEFDLQVMRYDEVLMITTQDKADTVLMVRVYPVGDLVETEPAEADKQATEQENGDDAKSRCDAETDEDPFEAENAESENADSRGADSDVQSAFDRLTKMIADELGVWAQAKAGKSRGMQVHSSLTVNSQYDFDALIEAIQATVAVTTWDPVGGPGSIAEHEASRSIVVNQTESAQAEVLALLRALRAAKAASQSREAE